MSRVLGGAYFRKRRKEARVTVFGTLGRRLVTTEMVSLARLKWLGIVLPLAALLVFVALVRSSFHDWLHESPGVFFLASVLAVCVFAFASVMFALVEDLEARVLDQNRELSHLLARTERQNAELAALLTVGRASASSLELSPMLDEALDAIIAVTSAEAAEVWLAEGAGLQLERLRGVGRDAFGSRSHLLPGEGLPGIAAASSSIVVVHDRGVDSRLAHEEVAELGLKTFCALPLRRPTGTIGVLAVAARPETAFESPDERRLLTGIGDRIALAIENARLHDQVLDRAVLEERERIARELHDGLAQVLGYINTQTQAVKKLLETQRVGEATSALDAMGGVARDVYADVREAIVGLRGAPPGLVPAIRDYLSRLPRMPGCEVELRVEGDGETLSLPPKTEIQLVRIVQEALSNVRKHAAASRVEVVLRAKGDEVELDVVDDGHGFDPSLLDPTGWPRLGLQTMRERAQAIGGALDVVSAPGHGTRIALHVPAQERKEVAGAGAPR